MSYSAAVHFTCCVAVALTLVGCGKAEPLPTASPDKAPAAPTESAARKYRSATIEEAEEFGQRLQQAFENDDRRELAMLVDWEEMAAKASKGLGSPEVLHDLVEGLLSTTFGESNLFNVIRTTGGPDAKYEFLRVMRGKDRPRVWFRVSGASGINYHDFVVVKQGDRLRAVDIYILMSGEMLTQTWRRGMLPIANEHAKNWLQKMTSSESAYVRNFRLIERFVGQVNRGDAAGALATYRQLPEDVRFDKSLLLLRYRAANQSEDFDELMATAADVKKTYPGDACLDLLMIDSLFLQKQFDAAVASIDRVENLVGPDPHLASLRGSIYFEANNYAKARESLEQAIAGAPHMVEAYSTLLLLGLATGDHQLTYDTLKSMETKFDLTKLDLNAQAGYADFAGSPQGQAWLAETSAP